jgi:hypothetical protein
MDRTLSVRLSRRRELAISLGSIFPLNFFSFSSIDDNIIVANRQRNVLLFTLVIFPLVSLDREMFLLLFHLSGF